MGCLWLLFCSLATVDFGGLLTMSGQQLTDVFPRIWIAGPFIFGAILVFCGLVLLEGKKRSVLFLRPFNSIGNERAMMVFSRSLGRNFTVVALDDGAIAPPLFSARRMLIGIFVFAPAALALFVVGALVLPSEYEDSSIGGRIPAVLAVLTAITLTRATWRSLTQREKRPLVDNQDRLKNAARMVRALTMWGPRIFAPRMLIVHTTNSMWKAAVSEFGRIADLAIIDISRGSPSIEWELDFLCREKSKRFVIIGSDESFKVGRTPDVGFVEPYRAGVTSDLEDSEFESRIRNRLEGLLKSS